MNILDACLDARVFAHAFRKPESWTAWFAFLAALFGSRMDAEQQRIFQVCTQRQDRPTGQANEGWLICGRRAGKSFMLALIAVFLACFRDWRPYLAVGERATVMIIASDRKQARVIMRYCKGLLSAVKMLAQTIEAERQDSIDLANRVTIEVHSASFRTTRGYTIVAALLDELAFWRSEEDSSNPDHEIIAAIRPAMATIPEALLLCASSPYAKKGALWESYQRYFGHAGPILVWNAATRVMNPTVPQSFIDAEMEKDPASAAAEYLAEFRTDIEAYVSREAVESCCQWSVYERGQLRGTRYVAFVDPSGGSADSMTLAIAHAENDSGVLDAVREIKPPFSPEGVVSEFADLCKSYRISKITGDRYAGEWPREQFAKRGIKYQPSDQPKGTLYLNFLPLINSGKVRLLASKRLVSQLVGLERSTARGGKDSIDHARGGHDDVANAVAGALLQATAKRPQMRMGSIDPHGSVSWRDTGPRDHSRITWVTVDKNGKEVRR